MEMIGASVYNMRVNFQI